MARAHQVTDLGGPERLQTRARPMGVNAPVANVARSSLSALAESLTSLRPQIEQHLGELRADWQEAEANRAYDTIQGMTFDEAQKAVADGTMRKTESPWFNAAFQKQFGLAYAAQRRRDIVAAYNSTFDKEGGDIDSFLAGFAQEDYETYAGSEFIRSGIREGMDGVFSSIRDQHAEYRVGQVQRQAADNFYAIAGQQVDTAVAEGGDAQAALAALYDTHQSALGMTPDELDGQTLALAQRFANEGNLPAVEAILSADPTGRGAFTERSGYALKAQELRETAKATQGDALRRSNTDAVVDLKDRAGLGLLDDRDRERITTMVGSEQLSQSEAESLLSVNTDAQRRGAATAAEMSVKSAHLDAATKLVRAGQGYALQDTTVTNPVDGSTIKITAADMREAVVNEQLEALAPAGTAAMGQQLAEWGVDVTYKPWENALSSGYLSLTTALTKVGKDGTLQVPDAARAGYTVWKELAGSGNLRDRHVTDSAAASIYRDAEILEKTGMMTPDEALAASASIDRKATRTNLSTALDRDAFAAAVKEVTAGGWFEDSPINAGTAAQEVEKHARILMDLGMPMKAAVTKASESFTSSWTSVEGVLVNTRDRLLPPNFTEIAKATLDDFTEAHPDFDRDEVFLYPDPAQDYWYVTDRYGVPVPGGRRLHISELQKNPRAYSMDDANAAVRENLK